MIRELGALLFGIEQSRSYILQAKKGFLIAVDCAALVFLAKNKNSEHRWMDACLTLSQYPQIQICFLPGFLNSLSDLISRQWQEAYIQDKEPSSLKSRLLLPPCPPDLIKKVSKLSHGELTRFC